MKHDLLALTRRRWLADVSTGFAGVALSQLLATEEASTAEASPWRRGQPLFAPKAKQVLQIFCPGAASHLDLWDYKPQLRAHFGVNLPESVRRGQRITTMTSGQRTHPVAPSKFRFTQSGQCGILPSHEPGFGQGWKI